MLLRFIAIILVTVTLMVPARAQQLEGDYLYKVSTVRAATGSLAELLDWIAALNEANYFEQAGEHPPFVMRHSQGDHWDLMIITPMQSRVAWHSEAATRKRDRAGETHAALLAAGDAMIAFDEDHFAYGPPLSVVSEAYAANGFYHIEMFEAAAGKASELLEQRRMENAYLKSTGQTTNLIFRRAAGSNVDVFTIGFHKSLEAFAAPSPASDAEAEAEAAAEAAGFNDRADISFHLRSLISAHHDTLAVKVE